MKFAKITTSESIPKTKESGVIAYAYAFVLIILALSQLFAFDRYINHFSNFGLPGGALLAHIIPCVIVIAEVMAVPFVLRIHLSKLMKVTSMIMGWIVALTWLKLSLWLVLVPNRVSNIGILGTKIDLMPGWWAVFLSIALLMMSIWASWGLWPLEPRSKTTKKTQRKT